MPTAGPNNASAAVNQTNNGVGVWANPGNAAGAQNGTNATSTQTFTQSDYLKLSGMGWSLGAGISVTNLLVEVYCSSTATIPTFIYALRDATQASQDFTITNLPGAAGWLTVYNADPPAWADAEFSNNRELHMLFWNGLASSATVSVDAIRVTITYTLPVLAPGRRAFVPQQTGPRALIPQPPGDLTAQNFSYREPLPGAHTIFHPTPQMLGPRAFRPQDQYDPRVEVAPVAYQPPLPGAETPYHPTPHMLGPRGFRPQRYDPYTPDAMTIFNTIVLPAGDAGPVSIPLWTKGLYKPLNYPPLRYAPLRFKPPRYRKPF